MVRLLTKYPFSEADIGLPEVQAFDCGGNPWDIEVADWIKARSGDNSVLEDMKQFGTEVWLHRDEDGQLVGYSSLGQTKYTWPVGTKKKEIVSVIPFIGVQKQFQGEPRDAKDPNDKYAYQILDDLLCYAAGKMDRFPLLALSVDERNTRAIEFYWRRGFVDLKIPKVVEGVTYLRMAVPLDHLVARLRSEAE
jgi:ribosomal protein S18 acetylase RimI-like enzyme